MKKNTLVRILSMALSTALFIENGAVSYAAPTDIESSTENISIDSSEVNTSSSTDSDDTIIIIDEKEDKNDNNADDFDNDQEGSASSDVEDNTEKAENDDSLNNTESAASSDSSTESSTDKKIIDISNIEFPTGYSEETFDYEIESITDGYHAGNRKFKSYNVPSNFKTETLPPLRDQSPYGTCWAFATNALAEINLMKKGLISDADLSELHLAYFNYHYVNDPLGGLGEYDNATFTSDTLERGGNVFAGLNTYTRWVGVADENTARYDDVDPVEAYTNGLDESLAYRDVAHIENYYLENINLDSIEDNDLSPVKYLIQEYGAVAISLQVINSLNGATDTSVYNEENNCYYNDGTVTTTGGHAVSVVGWDDNFSKENFSITPPGDGAWLVRNSWYSDLYGSEYENSYVGYFWLSYYENTLGNIAYAADFSLSDNYDNNYQYAQTYTMGLDIVQKAANLYTAHAEDGANGELIKAVSFYTSDSNASYKIEVFTGFPEDFDPENFDTDQATEYYSQDCETTYAGYYTFKLNNEIFVNSGERFVVAISNNANKEGHTYKDNIRIGTESTTSFSTGEVYGPKAESGQSYYLYETSYFADEEKTYKWVDLGGSSNRNFAINVYTNNKVSDIEISPKSINFSNVENNEVSIGVSEKFIVKTSVLPANATNKKIHWSSSDTSIATVDDYGTIIGIKPGTVKITATSELGNISNSIYVTVTSKLLNLTITTYYDGSFKPGHELTFVVKTIPEDYVSNSEASISVSDESIIELSKAQYYENGFSGRIKTPGEITVTATLEDKSVSRTLLIPHYQEDFDYEISDDNTLIFNWTAAPGVTTYSFFEYDKTTGYITLVDSVSPENPGPCTISITKYKDLDTFTPVDYCIRSTSSNDKKDVIKSNIKKQQKYSIKYNVGNGIINSSNPKTYYDDDTTSLLNPYAPDGYYFDGWYLDSTYNKRIYNLSGQTGDLELYAKWCPNKYYVHFDRSFSDVTGSMSEVMSFDYDAEKALLANRFSRKGYKFNGWKTSPDAESIAYTDNQLVKNLSKVNNAHLTLYADWKLADYNITYVLDDQEAVNNNPSTYTIFDSVKLANPTVSEGIIFEGWYKDKSYSKNSKVTEIKKGSTGDLTLYAKLTPYKYTIKFEKNAKDAKGSMANLSMTYGVKANLSPNRFERNAYEFNGWKTSANAEDVTYSNYEEVLNLSKVNNGTITLYADWKPLVYTITYELGGQTNNASNPATYTVEDEVILADANASEGMSFVGWYKENTFKTKVVNIKKGTSGNLTLYAKYDIQKNKVSFNSNGGSNVAAVSYNYGSSISKPADPKKTDCTFKGWYKDAECTEGNEFDFGKTVAENIGSNSDFTLYAKWNVSIKYMLNGGTNNAENPLSYETGDSITLQAPTRAGYDFVGWYDNARFTGNAITEVNTNAAKSYTFYAKWALKSYNVVYDINNGDEITGTYETADGNNVVNVTYTAAYPKVLATATRTGYTFDGWFTAPVGGTKIVGGSTKFTSADPANTTIYAHWKPITYSVRFHSNPPTGKDTVKVQKLTYDDFSDKAKLTKNSYKFVGASFIDWNTAADGSGTSFADETKVTDNFTSVNNGTFDLYAQWETVDYVVFFDPGTDAALSGSLVKGASSLGELDEEDLTAMGFNASKVTDEMKARGFLQAMTYGEEFELSGDEFVRKGWTLTGWTSTKTKGVVKNSTLKNLTTTPEVIVMTAKWKQDSYRLSYNLNGGTYVKGAPKAVANYTSDSGVIYLPNCDDSGVVSSDNYTLKKTGYTFIGWFDNKDCRGKVYTSVGTADPSSDFDANDVLKTVTLYAGWQENTYSFTINPNGGGGSTETRTLSLNQSLPITRYNYRSGYTLTGYNTVANPTKENPGTKFALNSVIKGQNIAKISNDSITLYAQWTPDTNKITYNLNGGKQGPKAQATYKTGVGCTLPNPTKAGYEFTGWIPTDYTTGFSLTYDEDANVYRIDGNNDNYGNVTLAAGWTPKYYDLKIYYAKDGNKERSIEIGSYNYEDTVSMYDLVKALPVDADDTGRIVAFTTLPNGKGTKYLVNKAYSKLPLDKTIELYPQWGKNANYEIEYEYQDTIGYSVPNAIMSYDGSADITLPKATKDGHVFLGWAVESTVEPIKVTTKGTTTKISRGSAGKVTVFPVFEAIKYNVVIDPVYNNVFLDVDHDGKVGDGDTKFTKTTYKNVSYDSYEDVPALVRPGYSLVGYTTKKTYPYGTIYNTFSTLSNRTNSTVTLYPLWSSNENFSVRYPSNNNTPNEVTYPVGSSIKFGTKSKVGYFYLGLREATQEEYNDPKINPSNIQSTGRAIDRIVKTDKNGYITEVCEGNADSMVLIADYKPISYTVKITSNGGVYTGNNNKAINVTYASLTYDNDFNDVLDSIGNEYVVNNKFLRNGYVFAGLATDAKGVNMVMDANGNRSVDLSHPTTKDKSVVSLFAIWEKVVAEKPVVSASKNGTNLGINYTVSDSAANVTYDIQYSTNILFRNAVTIEDQTGLSKTISGLDADKTYYVRVRQKKTYTQANGAQATVVGAWSKRAAGK